MRAAKEKRQERILQLVRARPVDTQEDLAALLQAEGFAVTQATVSRDIRELRLAKVPMGAGRSRYAAATPGDRLRKLVRDCVTGVDASENLVVLSTLPGMAQAVAEVLDGVGAPEVIGTIAGERVVFAVIKPRAAVPAFLARLRGLLGQDAGATGEGGQRAAQARGGATGHPGTGRGGVRSGSQRADR